MPDKEDNEKVQNELMETIRKMMGEGLKEKTPEPENVREETEADANLKRAKELAFDMKPRDVKKHLDRFVIKQEDAKRVLSTAICDHYNHVKTCQAKGQCGSYFKQNIIMLGPTGVGKTHLIRHLADLIGVPFIKADATKFSETGYVGGDVEDLVRDLVAKADGDIQLAEYGMIYLDEIDKIASPSNMGSRDVSGSGVQRGLLKSMEETEVPLRNPQDIQAQMQSMMDFQRKGKAKKPVINTRHILFIVSGSFDGLVPIIEKRNKKGSLGFNTKKEGVRADTASHILKQVNTSDFMQFGFESEFIGRLPVRVVCNPLSEEDLYQILISSEDTILNQYIDAFKAYDIDMNVDKNALWKIAKAASGEGTGARGLFTVCEKVFRDLKYELPSSELKSFQLTAEMVDTPKKATQELLREERIELSKKITSGIKEFEKEFNANFSAHVTFDDSAIEALNYKVLEEGYALTKLLEQILSNYKYGLELIQKQKPRNQFVLSSDAIENPNAVLDQWIKEAYEQS